MELRRQNTRLQANPFVCIAQQDEATFLMKSLRLQHKHCHLQTEILTRKLFLTCHPLQPLSSTTFWVCATSIWEERAPSWLKSEGNPLSKSACCHLYSQLFTKIDSHEGSLCSAPVNCLTLGQAACTGPAVCGERPTPSGSSGFVNRYQGFVLTLISMYR